MKDPVAFLGAIFFNLILIGIVEFFYNIQCRANEEAREKNNDANEYVFGGLLLVIATLLFFSVGLWEMAYSFKTGLIFEFMVMLALLVINGILSLWLKSAPPITAGVISLIACLVLSVLVYFYSKDTVKEYLATWQLQSSTQGKLETKLSELTDLSDKLKTKKEEALKLKADYRQEISSLEQEIRQEVKANNLKSFTEANHNTRINYDLALIQKQKAYITKVEELEQRLNNGVLEMEFLQRSTEADLKMVKTFNEKEITELTGKINTVIEKYLPDAGALVVNIDNAKLEKPQKIWEEIVKKK
ncbi:MAG: hypothetical protein NTX82_03850 [Candidatus Parcubacteria bacterium]|nr:hypothetical protein [Candidatus Parcubacteria bacterium]